MKIFILLGLLALAGCEVPQTGADATACWTSDAFGIPSMGAPEERAVRLRGHHQEKLNRCEITAGIVPVVVGFPGESTSFYTEIKRYCVAYLPRGAWHDCWQEIDVEAHNLECAIDGDDVTCPVVEKNQYERFYEELNELSSITADAIGEDNITLDTEIAAGYCTTAIPEVCYDEDGLQITPITE